MYIVLQGHPSVEKCTLFCKIISESHHHHLLILPIRWVNLAFDQPNQLNILYKIIYSKQKGDYTFTIVDTHNLGKMTRYYNPSIPSIVIFNCVRKQS